MQTKSQILETTKKKITTMKRLLIIALAFCISLNLLAQKSASQSFYVPNYTEENAMDYFEHAAYLLPFEGIWQSSDGFKYAIEKDTEDGKRLSSKCRVVVLESSSNGWRKGQIKAFIELGSVDGAYSMKYYTRRADGTNTETQQVLLLQESDILMYFNRIDTGDKILLYRLYPQSSQNNSASAYTTTSSDKQWSGTGVAIASRYVVTNFHVVDGAKNLVITGSDGNVSKNYTAEIVASDKFNDLSILKVTDESFKGFPTINYGFSTQTSDIGTDIFVLGYPLISTMGEEIKLTAGVISSKTGFQGDVSLYQISAPVQPGNSGAPLFDKNGNLIGIVNAKHNQAENAGYAIKLSYLKNLIESANLNLSLTSNNIIRSYELKDKVKALSPLVVMIKANVSSTSGQAISGSSQTSHSSAPSAIQMARAEELYEKTREALNVGNNEAAYTYIKQCNELYRTDRGMLFQGYIAASLGDNEEAIEAYEYCYNNGFELEYISLELGKLYSDVDAEKAIMYFTKCININSRNIDAYFGRALLKGKTDRLEAIKDYKQVIKYDGLVEDNFTNRYHITTSYNNIAYGYLCLGITDNRVNENIKAALERIKFMDFIWDTDGEYAYKIGDYQRCINSMNNAIAIAKANQNKDRSNSYLYRGLAYLQLGDSLHAYLDLERAVEQNDSLAKVEIKKINVASLDFSMEPESKMIRKPSISKNKSTYLTLEAIEHTDDCTILYFTSETTRYPSYSINEHTYIRDNNTGIKYQLIATENCGISGVQMPTPYKDGKTRFQLYFPKLPAETKIIDFVEPEDSEWKIYGIKLK